VASDAADIAAAPASSLPPLRLAAGSVNAAFPASRTLASRSED
jgi:hypothetical protein